MECRPPHALLAARERATPLAHLLGCTFARQACPARMFVCRSPRLAGVCGSAWQLGMMPKFLRVVSVTVTFE